MSKDASEYQGDYKSGKKFNMKKIIPFIASGYKKDKIWLRKSIPEEKNYRIILALDNSTSMQEN